MLTKSQVKYIQSLNDKKFRKENGVFMAEGPRLINEILSNPAIEPVALYALREWLLENKRAADSVGPNMVYEVQPQELDHISLLSTANQVLGIFKQPDYGHAGTLTDTITLLLDGIQDPGNLGTIIRIADWFGLTRIVAGIDTVDMYNPKVVQSTMGSIARVKVYYEDLHEFISVNKHINLYASTLNGKPLSSFGKIKEGLLLIGNESKGISETLVRDANHQITIPRQGKAESLNAAVATGIILSHIV
jgi:TrmH family RNA methyltransferase